MTSIRLAIFSLVAAAAAQRLPVNQILAPQGAKPAIAAPGPAPMATYTLGNDDQIVVHALHVEEITEVPIRIASDGNIRLPMAGLIRAAGLTVGELEAAITERLRPYVLDPQVSVSIMEFRSEPISILGCVKNPGIYQLQGQKNLAEALSMAGGLDPAAGAMVKVTRERSRGPIPVFGALVDDTGKYTVAEISLTSILKADNPRDNIAIMAHDIITVPRAEMVYVMGNVQRAGGFPLTDGKSVSLLQALSLAGGLDHAASPKHSYLLRTASGSKDRDHIAVDLTKVISGQAEDMAMLPGDILFVPNNVPKQAILRGVEAAIQIGTGVAVYGRY